MALLAPVIGPLLGGWLTENASWHWLFFINVPICAVLVALLLLAIAPTPRNWHELREADGFVRFGPAPGHAAGQCQHMRLHIALVHPLHALFQIIELGLDRLAARARRLTQRGDGLDVRLRRPMRMRID